jgi:hypothetical protein
MRNGPKPYDFNGFEMSLEDLLASAFLEAGWKVERSSKPGTADCLASHGQLRYAIEFKAARDARRPQLQASLADALLQARHHAKSLQAQPLPVVGAPAISEPIARELEQYVERFGEGAPFGLIDARGRFELHGEGLETVAPKSWPPNLREEGYQFSAIRRAHGDLFSDRNRWLFKVLLAQSLPQDLVRAHRGRLTGTFGLAEAAELPSPTVSRFISAAREQGYVEVDPRDRAVRVVRKRAVLEKWRALSARRPPQFGARWLLLRPESIETSFGHLQKALASLERGAGAPRGNEQAPEPSTTPRVCLALFAACQQLGLGFVRGVVPHLYLEDGRHARGAALLERLGLRQVEAGEPVDVIVREPRYPESIFRAAVLRDGVPTADVIQCWLDVSHEEARGQEQAAHVWETLLKPKLAEEARQ